MAKTDSTKRRKRQSRVVSSEVVEEVDSGNNDGQIQTVSSDERRVEKEELAYTECTGMELAEEVNQNEQVTKKRKIYTATETSLSKKTKLINDGFCLFVGNLNKSKTFEEVREALGNYFMRQSLLVQDIRLDRSRKHAHVDLASQMDLTKALTLNGGMVLDKPIKVEKAKVKSAEQVNTKASPEEKKAKKDSRCLFLKNVPYSATKEDILKIFPKAVKVRFPDGTQNPQNGIAFVQFENKNIAKEVQQKNRQVELQGRVLIVDFVGEANKSKVTKVNDSDTKAPGRPCHTLFVSNLSYKVKDKTLKNFFQKAVNIKIPEMQGKPRGFAFIEFATVADAEKALKSSQNLKINKREIRVQFCEKLKSSDKAKVLLNTLIVMGLAEKTSAETLKNAFDGALSARVIVDKETGVSKRFGFVDFESDENCKAAKDAMKDCEIDGSKVTVDYAREKSEESSPGDGGESGHPAIEPAD